MNRNHFRCYRLTLRTKLLTGFAAVGLLITALLLVGHHFLHESVERLERTLTAEVKPLVRMNRLQASLHRLRVLEIELPRLTDYFAVSTHLELLRAEEHAFSAELDAFVRESPHTADDLAALQEAWRRYRDDLEHINRIGSVMDMTQVENVSALGSAIRFKSIARSLQAYAEKTETSAREARFYAVQKNERQRFIVMLLSAAGLLAIAGALFWFARSLVTRVGMLHHAALRIAEGERGLSVAVPGDDELSELGQAFAAMREKVEERERALCAAKDEQEARVRERTRDLDESNRQLRREIDERKRTGQQLRLLSLAIEQNPVSTVITTVDARIEYVNAAFERSTGLARQAVIGKTLETVQSDGINPDQYRQAWECIRAGQVWRGDVPHHDRHGNLLWAQEQLSPVSDEGGNVTHVVMIREDITLRKQHEEHILFQAHYDQLTKLPNRMLAMDRLNQFIAAANRNETRVGLMFVDLDDFKKVNDSLGHDVGDKLLVQAAHRLRQAVRASDTVARQGGDEFLIILSDLADPTVAEIVADKVVAAFSAPFDLDGNEVVVMPSIGLAIYPDDGNSPASLLRHADLAMYDAKDAGGSTYCFFNQRMDAHSAQRLALERDLRQALERQELRLHYQPILSIAEQRVVGAEALLRWESPVHGMVSPDRIIGLLEQTGLIVAVGRWALHTACMQAMHWRKWLSPDFYVTVNASPRQFRGRSFLHHVQEALAASGLAPDGLHIEVTEGLLIRNTEEVSTILEELDAMGICIAMDDFGTGYSSLSYLKRLPFHTLKIDREFIRDLVIDHDDRALVTAAINMGKSLGLRIVAEGVESAEQFQFLADQGCDLVQGYYFGRPAPADEFVCSWKREGTPAAAGMDTLATLPE